MWWNLKEITRRRLCGCTVSVTMAQGFDVIEVSEDARQDVPGLDASAAYISSLLSNEPPDIKLGVGGFSMGAATAIYTATCFSHGKSGKGTGGATYLKAVVGLSGWLPCARALSKEVEGYDVEGRASLPILLYHGRGDDVVLFRYGKKSAEKLISAGFVNLTFKPFNSLGHYINSEEMAEIVSWLTSTLELDGKSFQLLEPKNHTREANGQGAISTNLST